MRTSACEHTASKHVEITGIVQGVGFRPFVRNLATLHGLRGWVRNTTAGVELEVSGPFPSLDRFLSELVSRKPPRAYIENIDVTDSPPCNGQGFAILKSLRKMDACQPISPDIATCEECLSEMLDPLDRRYLYPFINCTNCGPRFTIIKDLPYDRPNTTMRMFSQCRSCNTEYADPADRRYHAQPNACPACGPHIRLVHTLTEAVSLPEDPRQGNMDVIRAAGQVLGNGMIVAVKGLGGYHLACDGTNENAVRRLRKNKRRSHKPFAVM
ncbi:MAG: acylphosphatase, partial [Thermodesulfobacteriota bacterium]